VDGITYTWDANGNMLSDGVNTYAYDKANRLKSFTGASLSASYAYNGLGDRMQQTVNGVPETYLLDTATGLTQVLADGAHTYLYGVDRISQQCITVTDYFLGDALGSVRQLTDASGSVILAKSYEPYGEVLDSGGSRESSYGFTGEWTDTTGLVYLRARYYAPNILQFIQPDPIVPNPYQPWELNPYTYSKDNPINLTDPAGTDPIVDIVRALRDETEDCFNKGDLPCVWRNYYALAVGGNLLGYTHAADHLFQFLFKKGDILYEPYPFPSKIIRTSYWVRNSNAIQTILPTRESEILNLIHTKAKSGMHEGYLVTESKVVDIPKKNLDRDLYYAMYKFALWAEVEYEISGCYEVTIKPAFRFWDAYDWHIGLAAGGPAIGVSGFKDEWTAALHDANMALEYEISGSWYGPNKIFAFPANWLSIGITLPPLYEKPAPIR
jgi:RHS repeat-associated protein